MASSEEVVVVFVKVKDALAFAFLAFAFSFFVLDAAFWGFFGLRGCFSLSRRFWRWLFGRFGAFWPVRKAACHSRAFRSSTLAPVWRASLASVFTRLPLDLLVAGLFDVG